MKKRSNDRTVICLAMICLTVVIALSGCGNSKVFEIDEYDWVMSTIQAETDNGKIVAYGTALAPSEETVVDLVCQTKDGSITLIDNTNNKTYTGSYTIDTKNMDSIVYDIEVEGKTGKGVSSLTTYNDGSSKPTLIFALDGYAISFFGE